MTKEEFFNAIIDGTIDNEALVEFAQAELERLEKSNEKAKARREAKRQENQPYFDKIMGEILSTDEFTVASVVAKALEVSTQKASSLLRTLVAEGSVEQTDVKAPKKGTIKGYKLA